MKAILKLFTNDCVHHVQNKYILVDLYCKLLFHSIVSAGFVCV